MVSHGSEVFFIPQKFDGLPFYGQAPKPGAWEVPLG